MKRAFSRAALLLGRLFGTTRAQPSGRSLRCPWSRTATSPTTWKAAWWPA